MTSTNTSCSPECRRSSVSSPQPDLNPVLQNRKKLISVQQSARVISQLLLEITWGERPIHHVKPWTDPASYALLSQKIGTILKLRQEVPSIAKGYTPIIKSLRILPISNTIFEISVVAHSNLRFRALALRLEEKKTGAHISKNRYSNFASKSWKATAVELG